MAQVVPNRFTSYQLSPEEEAAGQMLNLMQEMVIQNEIAVYAERRLNLLFDPANPVEFAQQEAHSKGAIEVLQYLLDRSAILKSGNKESQS